MNQKNEGYEYELARGYRKGTLKAKDRLIIDECFENNHFKRGQCSILHPYHFKAFEILFHNTDLSADELKELRESGKGTRYGHLDK